MGTGASTSTKVNSDTSAVIILYLYIPFPRSLYNMYNHFVQPVHRLVEHLQTFVKYLQAYAQLVQGLYNLYNPTACTNLCTIYPAPLYSLYNLCTICTSLYNLCDTSMLTKSRTLPHTHTPQLHTRKNMSNEKTMKFSIS